MNREICPHCQGTGWVIAKKNGREMAEICGCQKVDAVAGRLAQANLPPRFFKAELNSFFPDKNNREQIRAKKLAVKFVADYPAVGGKGMLFQGPTGVGKTRLLCAIGYQLIQEKNADVCYLDWNDLVREMRSGEDSATRDFEKISTLINRLALAEVLLFDELGSSKPSPWVEDNIYFLVNRRYNGEKITLFATNFFDDKVNIQETLTERIGLRIRSRIFEMANTVVLTGLDYRQAHM